MISSRFRSPRETGRVRQGGARYGFGFQWFGVARPNKHQTKSGPLTRRMAKRDGVGVRGRRWRGIRAV
jgi:hypothetical protein